METAKWKMTNLVFSVNGQRFDLPTVDPSMSLLEFLRTETVYKGAKLGCGEGGCGACVVLLSRYDPVSRQIDESAVSSCLTLLCSVHLCSVTTTEGLGNSRDGFHSIHHRFSGFHASQCGFCTPGMCMSLFSALRSADQSGNPPPVGFSKLTTSQAEKAISGNLCRCTGYRSIVDVCKSFSSDVDIEDLGLNSFWGKEEDGADVRKLPVYERHAVNTFPDFLKAEIEIDDSSNSILQSQDEIGCSKFTSDLSGSSCSSWFRPKSIDHLQTLMKSQCADEGQKHRVKLVAGNTCSGVYKDLDEYDVYIDLGSIPELTLIRRDGSGIEFGAAVTISKAIEALKGNENEVSNVFSKIATHLSKVASQFVRNTASMGGNIIMAQKYPFASDISTVLLAAGSSVSFQIDSMMFNVTLEEFLEKPPFGLNFILLSIRIPEHKYKKSGEESDFLFETYRASPRPFGNAVSYANAAFSAQMSSQHVVEKLQLAFGAYGSEHSIRTRNVEQYLLGKSITKSVMLEAIRLLRETILPREGTSHPMYRQSLVVSFLYDFLQSLSIRRPRTKLDDDHCKPLLSSKQTVKFSGDYLPVGAPMKKIAAEMQASGEAVYVDDIPSPKNCLYAAFVYSKKPMVFVKGIDFKSTPVSGNIISVITINDIPDKGKNVGSGSMFGDEPLFPDSIVHFAGEPLAIVIAKTQKLANIAAAQAHVDYATDDDSVSPIFSVDQAVKSSRFFKISPFLIPGQVGDISQGMSKANLKIITAEINLGSQYHFYMETQTALAMPDEDNCLVVYSSCQSPMLSQGIIAKCIGVPYHNIRLITRRVGGGFGGKALRSVPIAAACSLAAYKLQRPVRMYLDRKTDMVMTGGRHPMTINYSVAFSSDGNIKALRLEVLINAGITEDISQILPSNIAGDLKKYDWGAFSCDFKICKANLLTKTAMRGPGEIQGSYIAEAIIEHVASTLSIHPHSVRMMNLHSFKSLQMFYETQSGEPEEYTLPQIIEKLVESASFEHRIKIIQQFNDHNRWKKRGISCVPIVHPLNVMNVPGKVSILADSSIVVEVGGIELGQGLWTKVKQMVAFVLGKLCKDSGQEVLDRIRIIQADSLSLIQGGFTAGSTTSESSCAAVRLACGTLVDRLMPIKETITKQSGSLSWSSLISKALYESVNLSASAYYVPDPNSKSYLVYGAAVSEVEIDLLTGATIILRSDLLYDCGQSLNPAVDLGQIEGAFVQGIGFFMLEEYSINADGLVTSDGTWTYKIPTVDTIPKQFNVKILNSGHHKNRVLSSKGSGEPPLLLAASVHCAVRDAIKEARKELFTNGGGVKGEDPQLFQLPVPATMPVVKELSGFGNVERHLMKK